MKPIIRLPQESETEVHAISNSIWQYQYAYYRSLESREVNDPGQDYLTFLAAENCMLITVCDGVSLSYYGDIAAKFLGDQLLKWLLAYDHAELDSLSIQADIDKYLRDITCEATELLDKHELPSHIQGILREVLAAKKEHGSDSVYGAARVDLPSALYPNGRILIIWQGDIRIRLWSSDEESTERLGDQFHTSHRWNSRSGPVGSSPHVYCNDLLSFGTKGRLLLYSDGLDQLDSLQIPTLEEIKHTLNITAQNPSSDDMSFFNACWDMALIRR
ncbi:hypothetical protein EHS13_30075 [Paenibacillus psychroresistens]|uniref:PPM-type phosphatase domain-containing protein n=1 Tax=Paenibacillus psychroresistens TaxID=1778678 RepID=A0A6B8RTE0_9BACL|nr:hypothetical protein [Paenibacillus psychroresistens]QGQ98825.1 hypothetical protein EHS13_30075 [Paenibacillus psychroresistens]